MTSLTGMTALKAAEELRNFAPTNDCLRSTFTSEDILHLASLLEHGARGQAAPEPGELVRHLMRIPHAGDCPAIRLEVDDRRCTCGLHASVELARSQEQRIRELTAIARSAYATPEWLSHGRTQETDRVMEALGGPV